MLFKPMELVGVGVGVGMEVAEKEAEKVMLAMV